MSDLDEVVRKKGTDLLRALEDGGCLNFVVRDDEKFETILEAQVGDISELLEKLYPGQSFFVGVTQNVDFVGGQFLPFKHCQLEYEGADVLNVDFYAARRIAPTRGKEPQSGTEVQIRFSYPNAE